LYIAGLPFSLKLSFGKQCYIIFSSFLSSVYDFAYNNADTNKVQNKLVFLHWYVMFVSAAKGLVGSIHGADPKIVSWGILWLKLFAAGSGIDDNGHGVGVGVGGGGAAAAATAILE